MTIDALTATYLAGSVDASGPPGAILTAGEVEDGSRLLDQLFRVAVRTLEDGHMAEKHMKRRRLRR